MQSDQYHYLHHRSHFCLHQDKADKVVSGFLSATMETAGRLLTRCLAHSGTSWQRRGQVIAGDLRRRFKALLS